VSSLRLHKSFDVLKPIADARADACKIEYRIFCENGIQRRPIAIIDGIAITAGQFMNLDAIRGG
jgi:hypothetical protein